MGAKEPTPPPLRPRPAFAPGPNGERPTSPPPPSVWPGYDTLVRSIHAAPPKLRPALLAHAVEACIDGDLFKEDRHLLVFVQRAIDGARGSGEGTPC